MFSGQALSRLTPDRDPDRDRFDLDVRIRRAEDAEAVVVHVSPEGDNHWNDPAVLEPERAFSVAERIETAASTALVRRK